MIGVFQAQGNGLRNSTDVFVRGLLGSNNYLRQRSGVVQTYVGGNQGYSSSLTGRSPITNWNENVVVYTAELRDGRVFYMITVAPESESYRYNTTFQTMLNSIQLN
jgi:hypothetical protein